MNTLKGQNILTLLNDYMLSLSFANFLCRIFSEFGYKLMLIVPNRNIINNLRDQNNLKVGSVFSCGKMFYKVFPLQNVLWARA